MSSHVMSRYWFVVRMSQLSVMDSNNINNHNKQTNKELINYSCLGGIKFDQFNCKRLVLANR